MLLAALLGSVARPRLAAVADARGVQRPAHDLVADAGEVADATAADEHDRGLLELVPDARDVDGDPDPGRQPDACDLAEGGVRLLGGHRVDPGADATPLRRALQRGALRPLLGPRPALPHELLDRRHNALVCTLPFSPTETGASGQGTGRIRWGAARTPPPHRSPLRPEPDARHLSPCSGATAKATGREHEMSTSARCHPGVRAGLARRPPQATAWRGLRQPYLLLVRARDAAQHALGLLAREADERRLGILVRRELGELALTGEPVLGDRVRLDLDGHVPVPAHPRPRGDQLADDHVLLQPEQRIRLALDRGVREDPGGFLERRGRQPR